LHPSNLIALKKHSDLTTDIIAPKSPI